MNVSTEDLPCGAACPDRPVSCMLPQGHDHEHAWFTNGDGYQWPAGEVQP